DRGNLIIGEREVDKALISLENADVKIALVHHPLDWLIEDDERAVSPLLSNFQIILHGHIHNLGERKIIEFGHSTIYSSCGALFSGSRERYNCYNIIEINPINGEVNIKLREYFDSPRRAFDAALSKYEGGLVTHYFDAADSTVGQA